MSDEKKMPAEEYGDTSRGNKVEHMIDIMESMSAQRLMDIITSGYCALSLIVLTPDGTIVYANNIAVKGLPNVDLQTVKGKHLTQLTPPRMGKRTHQIHATGFCHQ